MIVSEGRRDPFEVVDIYNHKILANQSKAAIRRAIQNHSTEPSDIPIFKKLADLLNAAYNGDQNVSSSNIRAVSKDSLNILLQTKQAMEGMLRNPAAFRERLDELNKAATELSQGRMVSDEKLKNLSEFCQRYSQFQQQLLKQPSRKLLFRSMHKRRRYT